MRKGVFLALILSLAFNFGFLGAFIYRSLERRPRVPERMEGEPVPTDRPPQRFSDPPVRLRPDQAAELRAGRKAFQPKFREMRRELMRERSQLGELLLVEEIDSLAIRIQLDRIVRRQLQMEQDVICELLREREILEPHQREIFIRTVTRLQGGARQGYPGFFNPNPTCNRERPPKNLKRRTP